MNKRKIIAQLKFFPLGMGSADRNGCQTRNIVCVDESGSRFENLTKCGVALVAGGVALGAGNVALGAGGTALGAGDIALG